MGVSMVRKDGLGYPLKWFGHILKALTNVSNYFLYSSWLEGQFNLKN
jgi:hypothetical protein